MIIRVTLSPTPNSWMCTILVGTLQLPVRCTMPDYFLSDPSILNYPHERPKLILPLIMKVSGGNSWLRVPSSPYQGPPANPEWCVILSYHCWKNRIMTHVSDRFGIAHFPNGPSALSKCSSFVTLCQKYSIC